jgi:hypothetical protein
MKKIIIISLLASSGVVNAAVFKCESSLGRVGYQDVPCSSQYQSKKLAITPIDSKIVERAQEKLAIELGERKKIVAQRAEIASKEREMRAKELSATAGQDLVYETRKQTEAIEGNTRAANQNSWGGYYHRRVYENY